MADRNKIAQALPVEKLEEFNQMLASLPGSERTLDAIKRRAADELGIEISVMSAKAFRDTTFSNYLKRMERRREFAERVANVRQESTGATLADAAAENLAEAVFDLTEELGEGESLDLKKASSVAFIISKIRQGDVAKGSLEMKLKEFERREREREERKAALQKTITAASEKKGGLTKDTLEQIEAELAML